MRFEVVSCHASGGGVRCVDMGSGSAEVSASTKLETT